MYILKLAFELQKTALVKKLLQGHCSDPGLAGATRQCNGPDKTNDGYA